MSNNAPEKRQHERFLVGESLISVTLKPFGLDKEIWGIVTNTSMNGFQIAIPLQLFPETLVAVTVTREIEEDLSEIEHLVGRVRWCRPDDLLEETYNVGIEIQDLKTLPFEADANP
jgi:hypothetical protein